MSEIMTADELAEARELEQAATPGPWDRKPDDGLPILMDGKVFGGLDGQKRADANFIAAARTLAPRLLATVDALTERAERAEGERDTLLSCEGRAVAVTKARIAQERAEQERDEALALADARGRALESIVNYEPPFHTLSTEQIAEMQACEDCTLAVERKWPPSSTCNTHYKFLSKRDQRNDDERRYQHAALRQIAKDALSLTAPEALRQQQEAISRLALYVQHYGSCSKLRNDPPSACDCGALAALDATKGGAQ